MASNSFAATLDSNLSKMKYDFSSGGFKYDNLEEINVNEQANTNGTSGDQPKSSYFKIEFYQKYFNVNTIDVFYRIIGSMIPTFNQNFLINRIRPNPDLYGPFWISISLIFTIAIAGNVVSFLHNFGSDYKWHTDFHKVTSSAATILIYWWLMPTLLYIILKWRKLINEFTFIEILCIYGYSLSIYIPISILWLINITLLQWSLVLVGVLLSGSVLVFTFWPSFSADSNKKIAVGVMLMIIICHALLGISFMLYFFHYPNNPAGPSTTTSIAYLNATNATTTSSRPFTTPFHFTNLTTTTEFNNSTSPTNATSSSTTTPTTTLLVNTTSLNQNTTRIIPFLNSTLTSLDLNNTTNHTLNA